MNARLGFVACALTVVSGACGYFGDRPEPYRPPGIAEGRERTGVELYQRDCAFCHGQEGGGTRSGPDLVSDRNGPALTDFMLRTGRMPIDDARDPVVPGSSRYSEAEIAALVEHVTSFGGEGPQIPEPHPELGDLSDGMALYQDNCAACHSTTGIGGAVPEGVQRDVRGDIARRGGIVAPSLLGASSLDIAEAMRTGPGAMPPFSEEGFDDRDVDSIVRYIHTLQSDVDRGGASVGRIGPVAEGAVALAVGLGVIVLFTRWIGTTRP